MRRRPFGRARRRSGCGETARLFSLDRTGRAPSWHGQQAWRKRAARWLPLSRVEHDDSLWWGWIGTTRVGEAHAKRHAVVIPLLLSACVVAPVLAMLIARTRLAGLTALIPALYLGAFLRLMPEVTSGAPLLEQQRWIPSLGVELAVRVDGLALLFVLLITGIGSFIFLYASHYLARPADRGRFFAYLTLFMAAMLGAVVADDLLTLMVFWELTSITSFLLIGFDHERPEARRSAQQGLLITVGGGLFLLAGILLLGDAAETYRITEILEKGPTLAGHPHAPAIIALIAIGAFTKSAQVPLHFWLPNAMVAPTPVSAFLHSATMVKLGVYLLLRLEPVFGEHSLWVVLLTAAGVATMVTGSFLTLLQSDLKRVLAYSTLVSLGLLVMLTGLPGEGAALAAVTFLMAHALYKAGLFLTVGIIEHETGTRDASRLGGLRKAMPNTALVAVLGGLSMAGAPPLFGFVAKELVYEAASVSWLLVVAALIANVSMIVAAGAVAVHCFFGARVETPSPPQDPAAPLLVGPAILGLAGVVFGAVPMLGGSVVGPAARTVGGAETPLALWHGFTPALALSAATLLLGGLLYWRWSENRAAFASSTLARFSVDALYDRALLGLQQFANWQTGVIQRGSLRGYLGVFFAVVALALFATAAAQGGLVLPISDEALGASAVLSVLLILATIAVVRAGSFMAGIVAAGMVGFSAALIFLFNGAPDLAFTQFAVEALSIVILLAVVGRMPFRETDRRSSSQRSLDAVVAIGFGVAASAVLLAIVDTPFDTRLSDFFRRASVPEAYGRNLVNVIIVDFRGVDTLGEITVLTLAATAAAAVLATAKSAPTGPVRPRSLLLRTAGPVILPIALVYSLYLLYRGHNEPGGGFVGGLIMAAGLAVHALPRGRGALLAMLRLHPRVYGAAGVLLAFAAGLPALVSGEPFLSHRWIEIPGGPVIGTALAFDLGVYLAVVGAVLTFLSAYLED